MDGFPENHNKGKNERRELKMQPQPAQKNVDKNDRRYRKDYSGEERD